MVLLLSAIVRQSNASKTLIFMFTEENVAEHKHFSSFKILMDIINKAQNNKLKKYFSSLRKIFNTLMVHIIVVKTLITYFNKLIGMKLVTLSCKSEALSLHQIVVHFSAKKIIIFRILITQNVLFIRNLTRDAFSLFTNCTYLNTFTPAMYTKLTPY